MKHGIGTKKSKWDRAFKRCDELRKELKAQDAVTTTPKPKYTKATTTADA